MSKIGGLNSEIELAITSLYSNCFKNGTLPRLRPRTESLNVQTVPEGICLCPDFRAFKITYVQTFVRLELLMSRFSRGRKCFQNM